MTTTNVTITAAINITVPPLTPPPALPTLAASLPASFVLPAALDHRHNHSHCCCRSYHDHSRHHHGYRCHHSQCTFAHISCHIICDSSQLISAFIESLVVQSTCGRDAHLVNIGTYCKPETLAQQESPVSTAVANPSIITTIFDTPTIYYSQLILNLINPRLSLPSER
ncbi:hypothetical protein H920_10960 [Fukomys damarensis]|uniref:Uncharacterized protein n=1 Tax=Fukomys damarensis TaxID=885580 RepID=A0A091D6B3_FUKDA|nr:hypothetical protein H920_10960 [Fukomys damarensis]